MHRDIETGYKNIKAHVTEHVNNKSLFVLRAYLIDAKTGCRRDGSKTLTRFAYSAEDVPRKERYLIEALLLAAANDLSEEEDTTSTAEKNATQIDINDPLAVAFKIVCDNAIDAFPTWNLEVTNRWITYFRRNVLGPLGTAIDDGTLTDETGETARDFIYPMVLESVSANGKASGKATALRNTVDGNLSAIQQVYDACRRIDGDLPKLQIASFRKTKIKNETCKSLPRQVRRCLVRKLQRLVKDEPLLVIATVIMFDIGSRTAEAAAVIPAIDIVDLDDGYKVLKVYFQEKAGKRSPILKSSNSYRIVPFSFWGITLIETALRYVPGGAYDAAGENAPLKKRELSAWIRDLLIECGLERKFIEKAREEETRHPDIGDDGKPIFDVEAYILRRDRASRWRNVCNLDSQTCDALLGHEIHVPKRKQIDYSSAAELLKIAPLMERYVYDHRISRHPGIRYVKLHHGMDLKVVPFEALGFVNDGDVPLLVRLDLQCAIADEGIKIVVGGGGKIKEIHGRHAISGEADNAIPIIGTNQLKGGRSHN